MLTAWLTAALAVLTKGIVVGVLAGGSLIIYSLLDRDARPWRRLHWLPGVALFLIVSVPWFVLVAQRDPGFLEFFFIHEHVTRFLTTVNHHAEPWWYFLVVLMAVGVLPWILPLARALPWAWQAGGSEPPAPGAPVPPFKPLKFLLVFAGFTLVFFSLSGSQLPPYILPMLPPLAVVAGAHASDQRFFRGTARLGALIVCIVSIGVLIYSLRKNSYVPREVIIWAGVAVAAVAAAVVVTWRDGAGNLMVQALATAGAGMLAWQALLCAYTGTPPQRSAWELVREVRPYVHPDTALYSVGQYRETISPYLQRTLIVIGFSGELRFGLKAQPGKDQASLAAFSRLWRSSTNAVAFFAPKLWDRYRSQGLPGRVVAADYYTVAVSRS